VHGDAKAWLVFHVGLNQDEHFQIRGWRRCGDGRAARGVAHGRLLNRSIQADQQLLVLGIVTAGPPPAAVVSRKVTLTRLAGERSKLPAVHRAGAKLLDRHQDVDADDVACT
jgi:hypothetical protein